MLKKTNTLIAIFVILVSVPLLAWQASQPSPPQAQLELPPDRNPNPTWSKNATDEETERLIQEAEILLNGNDTKKPKELAAEVLSSREMNSGINTEEAIRQEQTLPPLAPVMSQPSNKLQADFYAWLPGFGALIISGILLLMVKSELKKNRHASLEASQLINDISDLQNNIKEWELENHYSHISEISEHIDALETAVDAAGDQRHHIDTSISTSIELNKKSLDILKRANKELSKSLVSQVQKLEEQLTQTIEAGINKINNIAEEQGKILTAKQTEMLAAANSKINSSIAAPSVPAAGLNTAPKPQKNWMDIIKSELNSTPDTTPHKQKQSTTVSDHAAMLRESIERQKTILHQHKTSSSPSESNSKSSMGSFFDGLKNSNILKEEITEKPKPKPIDKKETIQKPLADNNEILPAEVDLESITTEIVKETSIAAPISHHENQRQEPDEIKLHKKLEHAQKWHNYADAAEICSQLAEINPANAEVFDTWGQMLAHHAADIKGNEGTELLKLANKKMHKASILDSSNYKIFNNWGVILKNMALTYSNTHEAEKTLALARRKFETSISLNPTNHEALSNWGNALVIQARYRNGALQESLLQKACERFEQAIKIKPDKANTLHSWGNALFRLANCKKDAQARNNMLQQANVKWQQANKIKPGIANKELRVIKSMVPPLSKADILQTNHSLQK